MMRTLGLICLVTVFSFGLLAEDKTLYTCQVEEGAGTVVLRYLPQLPSNALDHFFFIGIFAGKQHLELSSIDMYHEAGGTVVSYRGDPKKQKGVSKTIHKWLKIKIKNIPPPKTKKTEPNSLIPAREPPRAIS